MKEMQILDMDRIRKALPDRSTVTLIKHKGKSPAIECIVNPHLSEKDFEMCKDWQRDIIGKENISEFYTEETGLHWFVFLERIQWEFQNVTEDDMNSFVGMDIVKDGKLNSPK